VLRDRRPIRAAPLWAHRGGDANILMRLSTPYFNVRDATLR
jgi:hypothetical protein